MMLRWQELQRLLPSDMDKDLALTCLSTMMHRLLRGTMFLRLTLEILKKALYLVYLAKNMTKYSLNVSNNEIGLYKGTSKIGSFNSWPRLIYCGI